MWYSIFQLDDSKNIHTIIGITREKVEQAARAFHEGKSEITISGRKRFISSSYFAIYQLHDEVGCDSKLRGEQDENRS